ncbi:carboxypeptidase regulatory-like domain-containing protein [Calditrichota bacterium]
MKFLRSFSPFQLMIITLTLLMTSSSVAFVTLDPHGVGVEIGVDEEEVFTLTLHNDNEIPVAFTTSLVTYNENGDQLGPRREDGGNEIADYFINYYASYSMAWDGEWIWVTRWSAPYRLIALNPEDGEIEIDVQIDDQVMCMTYMDGLLWVCPWGTGSVHTYDLEGEQVGEYEIDIRLSTGMSSNREDLLFIHDYYGGVYVYELQGDELEELNSFNLGGTMGNNTIWSIEWVTAHKQGELWGHHAAYVDGQYLSRLFQVDVIGDPTEDDVLVEAASNFSLRNNPIYIGLAHDGENMWHGSGLTPYLYEADDGVFEFGLLAIEPPRGTIDNGEELDLELMLNSTNIESGVYFYEIDILLDAADQEVISFDAMISVDDRTGDFIGTITDAADGEPAQGCTIQIVDYNISRISDVNGEFEILNLPPGEYEVLFTLEGFSKATENIEIIPRRVTSIDVDLYNILFLPSRDDIVIGLAPGDATFVQLTARNPSGGVLNYAVRKETVAGREFERWDSLSTIPIEQETEDSYLYGVTVLDGYYYVSGGNSGGGGDEPNYIYILDKAGEYFDQFEQFGDSNFGMRDLTTDGEYLYGVEEDQVYKFTKDGDYVDQFQSPSNPTHCIAYDSNNELLWLANQNGTLYAFDLDGNLEESLDHPIAGRIYSFDYFADDNDGYNLYLQTLNDDDELQISRYNPVTEDVEILAGMDIQGDTPNGMCISNHYNPETWTLVSMIQARSDRIELRHFDYRLDWLTISPRQGIIRSNSSRQFNIRVDTDDFHRGEYFADLVFTHNGIDSPTIIPVDLTIEDGRVQSSIYINLRRGWNMVSANLDPDDDDIRNIFASLVSNDLLVMAKNSRGNFYSPAYDFNNIENWEMDEGYLLKVTDVAELVVNGLTALPDTPIDLLEGWQMVSYLPGEPVDAVQGLSNIGDQLIQAKNDYGKFYIPAFGFSNLPPLRP